MKKVELPLEEVRGLIDSGQSYRDVAARFGCSVGRVAAFAKEHGLRAPAPSETPQRRSGRPASGDQPPIPWRTIDELLVGGRTIETANGPATSYPTYRELAEEFGISVSLIGRYAAKHQCLERRHRRQSGAEGQPSTSLVPSTKPSNGGINVKASRERDHETLEQWGERFREDLREGRCATHSVRDYIETVRAKRELEADAGVEDPSNLLEQLLARLERGQRIQLERQRMIIECPDVAGVPAWNDAHWQRMTGTELPAELRPTEAPGTAIDDMLDASDLPAIE